MSRKLHRDAELARDLGLSWAAGDRIVIITSYGGERGVVYWHLSMRVPGGVVVRSGASRTTVGKVSAELGRLVRGIRAKYGEVAA